MKKQKTRPQTGGEDVDRAAKRQKLMSPVGDVNDTAASKKPETKKKVYSRAYHAKEKAMKNKNKQQNIRVTNKIKQSISNAAKAAGQAAVKKWLKQQ